MQKVIFVRLNNGSQSRIVDNLVQKLERSYKYRNTGFSFEIVTFSPEKTIIKLENEIVILDVQLKYLAKKWESQFPNACIETINYRGYGLSNTNTIFEQILSMQEKIVKPSL